MSGADSPMKTAVLVFILIYFVRPLFALERPMGLVKGFMPHYTIE
jgi:hypothetical protein